MLPISPTAAEHILSTLNAEITTGVFYFHPPCNNTTNATLCRSLPQVYRAHQAYLFVFHSRDPRGSSVSTKKYAHIRRTLDVRCPNTKRCSFPCLEYIAATRKECFPRKKRGELSRLSAVFILGIHTRLGARVESEYTSVYSTYAF